MLSADGGEGDALFRNKAIERESRRKRESEQRQKRIDGGAQNSAPFFSLAGSLPADARAAFLADAVAAGQARWLDDADRRRALVLWRPLAEWADALAAWARSEGHTGAVLTLDELADPRGDLAQTCAELAGAPAALLLAAAKELERGGRAAVFGGGGEDVGVKFL